MPATRVVEIGALGAPAPEPRDVTSMTGLDGPAPRRTRPTGKLLVRSVPSGATVVIDDQVVEHRSDGTSELPYSDMPHWLELRSPNGEKSPRTPIRISVGKTVPYCWDFDRNQKCEQ